MIFLAVNLHYVAQTAPESPRAIFPISVPELDNLAAMLLKQFEPVSIGDVVAAVDGARALPEQCVLITFDDGLREQVDVGFPVLEKHGITAVCFVAGKPLVEHQALHVHKLHAIRDELDEPAFAEHVATQLAGTAYSIGAIDPATASAMYRYDTPEAATVKYLLNVALPVDLREHIISELFREMFDESDFVSRLYLDAGDVRELAARGSLGAHTYAHVPLRQLPQQELAREFSKIGEALQDLAGVSIPAVSYPYGGPDAVDRRVAAAAEQAGFRVGLTMERSFNRTLGDPLLLARIDWIDAPGGRRPLCEITGAGEPTAWNGMTAARTRYYPESSEIRERLASDRA